MPLSLISTCTLQLLFIERLLYSAEIKYLTAYLLAEAAVRNQEKDVIRNRMQDPLTFEGTNSDIFRKYATSLKSYSIMNTALCRSHRSAKKHKNYSENSTKSDDDAAITDQSTPECAADKFTRQDTSLADQCMYLSRIDTIELMNSIKMDPGSVTLRFRRVAVLEKLMK